MLAFARMFLRGGEPVLSADSVRAMTTDQLTPEQKAHGGLGPDFFAGQSWSFLPGRSGHRNVRLDGGFGTSWHVDPRRDLVVIVLTQRMFEGPDDCLRCTTRYGTRPTRRSTERRRGAAPRPTG